MYWNRDRKRGEPLKVYCDDCAEWHVPFAAPDKYGERQQERPWCWAPWSAGEPCHACGEEL